MTDCCCCSFPRYTKTKIGPYVDEDLKEFESFLASVLYPAWCPLKSFSFPPSTFHLGQGTCRVILEPACPTWQVFQLVLRFLFCGCCWLLCRGQQWRPYSCPSSVELSLNLCRFERRCSSPGLLQSVPQPAFQPRFWPGHSQCDHLQPPYSPSLNLSELIVCGSARFRREHPGLQEPRGQTCSLFLGGRRGRRSC